MSRYFLDPYGFKIPEIPGIPSAGYTFCPQYQTVYDYWPAPPDAAYAQQQDIMVRALVAAGIWAKLDVFYVFAQNDSGNALTNWINPGTFDAIVVNGPINFVQWQGFTGNGVNQYLRTGGYNPTTAAGNYVLNSGSCFIYSRTDNLVGYDFGANDALNDSYGACGTGAGISTIKLNDNTLNNVAVANSLGFYIFSRLAANNRHIFKNGGSILNDAPASTGLPNIEMFFMALNNAGVPGNQSTKQYSIAGISGGINIVEAPIFTNIIETYMDFLGTGVIP